MKEEEERRSKGGEGKMIRVDERRNEVEEEMRDKGENERRDIGRGGKKGQRRRKRLGTRMKVERKEDEDEKWMV